MAVFGCRGEFKVLCQHGMALLHGIGTRLFFQWDVAAVFLRQGKEKKDVDNIGIDFIVLLLFFSAFRVYLSCFRVGVGFVFVSTDVSFSCLFGVFCANVLQCYFVIIS